MSNRERKSLVVGEIPLNYVPEYLRSPVRIRRFWYVRMWDYPRAFWGAIFKKKRNLQSQPKPVGPAMSEEGGAK